MGLTIKTIFMLILLTHVVVAGAFTKGLNQAWFKSAYAYQWLDRHFDPAYNEKLLKLTKDSGSELLRIWLYEGTGLGQFDFDPQTQTIKLKAEVLRNLRAFLQMSRRHGVKISLTFLDGNAFKTVENSEIQSFWWNVIHNEYGKFTHFYDEAIAPVYKLIDGEFKDVVAQIDLINEVNAMEYYHQFRNPAKDMPRFLCQLRRGSPVPVTASLGWADAEEQLLNGHLKGAKECLNFYDIHLYNDTGTISHCEDFKLLAQNGVRFQLGEFGQASEAFDDELQAKVTNGFLNEAKRCGFQSALAWRLDDSRTGYNPEARFSFLAFGQPRPAYLIFKNFAE